MDLQLHDPAFLAVASGSTPALDLFFSATKALDSRITFTRASTGTYIDSAGLVQSASTNVARFTHDPVTLASLGLLVEESRTNLLLRSEEFDNAAWVAGGEGTFTITANAGVAPSGATTADKIVGAFTTTGRTLYQNVVSINTTYTLTVWMKTNAGTRSMRLFMNDTERTSNVTVTSEWQRFSLTGAVGGTLFGGGRSGVRNLQTLDEANHILIWGAQLEAGSFATSYIPTTGASATRAADVATITGTSFSSWFNSTGGTLVAEGVLGATSGSRPMFTFGGSSLGVGTRVNGSAASIIWRTPTNYDAATGTVSAGNIKQAFSYAPSQLSGVVNGGDIATNTPPSSLPATYANIGASDTGFDFWYGTIARIRYYRRRLSDQQLQALTAQ